MPVNDTTANRSYQKPNIANTLADDVGRLRSALDAIDTDMASKAPTAGPTFTGVTTVAAGSAGAPSLTFTGATSDTGIYSPGTDQVAISTGGTGQLFVAADGRVGIGTSAPSYPLELWRSGENAELNLNTTSAAVIGRLRIGCGNSINYIRSEGTKDLQVLTDSLERFRCDSSGRLLVGTSSAVSSNKIQIFNSGIDITTYSADQFAYGNLFLRKSRGTTVGSNTIVLANDELGGLYFVGADGSSQVYAASIRADVDGTPGTNDMPGRLVFSTTADGASTPTERMRIDNAGQVGVGVTPSTLFHVGGITRIGANNTSDAELQIGAGASGNRNAFIDIVSDTTYADYGLRVIRDNSGPNAFSAIRHRGTGSLGLITEEVAPIVFNINSTERARIDSSGRLLVGTSASRGAHTFEGTDYASSSVIVAINKNTVDMPFLQLIKSRGAAIGSVTAVQNGDYTGGIEFIGADGSTATAKTAGIYSQVDGAPGINDMPGRIVLSTTLDGASTPTEQWRLNNAGTVIYNQPAPAAVNTTATLTVANLTAKIITSTTAAAVTMTLPLGTDMDNGFSGLYTNMAFEWTVINTGGTNAVTVQGNTAHTIVGSGTVSANNSGRFLSRRTAATTWVTYRLSS